MAKWIRFDETRYWCSKCHSFSKTLPDKCPCCGAIIEGVKE